MAKKRVVNSKNAKGRGDYADIIQQISEEGKCPFCQDNFKYHRKPILKKRKGWFITEASWPYKDTKHHFIVLGEKHKEEITEVKNSDWEAINFLLKWISKEFKIKGGGFLMRFGDTHYTGASVCHLHAHIIVPEIDKKTKEAKVVYFPIG